VLSRLFRLLFLQGLVALHVAGKVRFFADLARPSDAAAFRSYLAPLRKKEWVVYAKQPFAGPAQVLAYLARYTHRVAIANSRLVELEANHVRFRWKDYRDNGRHKVKVMRLGVCEFIRRFLLHVLPNGFHRIRHYGLFANGHRAEKLALCRRLLSTPPSPAETGNPGNIAPDAEHHPVGHAHLCPYCGGRMTVVEIIECSRSPRHHPRKLDGL